MLIRRWKEDEVDNNIVMWIRVYGIPCHGWNSEFFVALANSFGSFVCLDDNTSK